jgi:soluble lytic murein transglycosylase
MRFAIRIVLAGLALVATERTASAQDLRDPSQNPLAAIKADRWVNARSAAARFADPVTEKLVLYYRLLAPGAATAPEIAGFMRDNPDWPSQALLERRRQEAIAAEPDEAIVLTQCAAAAANLPNAMLRCAEALANAGRTPEATATARDAWVSAISDPQTEAAYLKRWNGIATQDEEWARFQRLAWSDATAAARQITRLGPAHHAAAEARLALKRDDPVAESLFNVLSPSQRDDPGLFLDRARYLRRANRDPDALALWRQGGTAAQKAAPGHLGPFWQERNLLARALLKEGDNAGAYAIVAAHGQTASESLTEAEFLAGFIALRRLNDPAIATRHFRILADSSRAAITQGRAHYWLGRCAAASGVDPTADYRRAAAWPTTFYGQLAAVTLGDTPAALSARIDALKDTGWVPDTGLAYTGHEVVRAAAWLVAWGDPHRARPFLLRMDELAPIPAERSLTAALALRLGLPDVAVFIARRIGRDGGMLPQKGWPVPFEPPGPLDPAVALGIMRQESSFDVGAVSPSGARGLMQLMPFTAQDVAKKLGIPAAVPSLTSDAAHNMRLGTRYILHVLDQFDGSLPLAIAGYNAGPHRVQQWLAEWGDPRRGPPPGGTIDMIDWMELIPVNETRNYVQRVLENIVIYRARLGEAAPTLMAQWTR